MLELARLGVAIGLSAALYVGVFSVVHRPLTIGEVPRMLDAKTAYAETLPPPRVLVFAGSNGRFSHRCEPISAATGRPCVNMSVAVGIGLDFQLERLASLLGDGDVVYMPLEYSQYRASAADMASGPHNPLIVRHYPEYLASLDATSRFRAHASFDLPFLLQGGLEMALEATGFRRLSALTAMTPQGDATGHAAATGGPYRAFLETAAFDHDPLPARSHAIDVIERFLAAARQRGATVVGGLPTAPDRRPIDDAVVDRARAVFEDAGQRWLALPGRSQYPLSCFYDTLYHLNEECQIEHSHRVGAALRALFTPAALSVEASS